MAVVPFNLPPSALERVDTLLLDLGGVLYAIDPAASLDAINALRRPGAPPLGPAALAHPVFQQIETGAVDPRGFRRTVREAFGIDADDAAIDGAWNRLLLGVVPGRIDALRQLGASHRLLLLSNTNAIHIDHLRGDAGALFDCFEALLLSFELGCRKPDGEIYRRAAALVGIEPGRTLFVDDSAANCRGAEQEGFLAHHLPASTLS